MPREARCSVLYLPNLSPTLPCHFPIVHNMPTCKEWMDRNGDAHTAVKVRGIQHCDSGVYKCPLSSQRTGTLWLYHHK